MKELRCIVFNEREVVSAMLERRRRRRDPIPNGTVKSIQFRNVPEVESTLTLVDDHGMESTLTIPEAEALPALVSWCMERRIPLPAEAEKSLYVIKNALTLMITKNFPKRTRMVTGAADSAPRL